MIWLDFNYQPQISKQQDNKVGISKSFTLTLKISVSHNIVFTNRNPSECSGPCTRSGHLLPTLYFGCFIKFTTVLNVVANHYSTILKRILMMVLTQLNVVLTLFFWLWTGFCRLGKKYIWSLNLCLKISPPHGFFTLI